MFTSRPIAVHIALGNLLLCSTQRFVVRHFAEGQEVGMHGVTEDDINTRSNI